MPRSIKRVRLAEQGEMRQSPDARWIEFEAEEIIEARQSGFVWKARFRAGRVLPILVTDAYENGKGRLVVKVGGALPVVNARGPEVDRGELQRCLVNTILCPPMLICHPTLEWTPSANSVLGLRDASGVPDASVFIEIAEDGHPICFRADRPRTVGKRTIVTPWVVAAEQFFEREGLMLPARTSASWQLPTGLFAYFRSEIRSYTAERE